MLQAITVLIIAPRFIYHVFDWCTLSLLFTHIFKNKGDTFDMLISDEIERIFEDYHKLSLTISGSIVPIQVDSGAA